MYIHVCIAFSLASVRLERLIRECLPSVASIPYFPEFIALFSMSNGDRVGLCKYLVVSWHVALPCVMQKCSILRCSCFCVLQGK